MATAPSELSGMASVSSETAARTLDDVTIRSLAERLVEASRTRIAISPITSAHPKMTVADAYAIQEIIIARRISAGERTVGWKLGLTSRAMQEQLGVDQPDYSPILSDSVIPERQAVSTAELIQPRIEAEIAFVLRAPLRGPGVTVLDVLAATAGVAPALEIIDSRIVDWKIGLADTIADIASSARVTVGGALTPVDGLDLRTLGVILERGGEIVATGAGGAVLGNPAEAVAWAANTLGKLGVTLEPGHLIMPGALHASVPAKAGDVFRADFDRLGAVTARFG